MDADPKFDPDILRDVDVLRGHAALDVDAAARGIDCAGEFCQQSVAGGFDDAAAIRGNGGIDERFSDRLQPGQRVLFVAAHQAAVAGHIRRQHSRKPPFHLRFSQKIPRYR